MVVVLTNDIAEYNVVQTLGIVHGNTVRAKHVGRDLAAGLKSILGGEIYGYTELLTESRPQAPESNNRIGKKSGSPCHPVCPILHPLRPAKSQRMVLLGNRRDRRTGTLKYCTRPTLCG